MRKIATLVLALAPWCVSQAAWVQAAPPDTDVGTLYFDPATLKHFDEGVVRVWVLAERETPSSAGWMSYAGLVELDCRGTRSRAIQTFFYTNRGAAGQVVRMTGESLNWDAPPGAPMQRLLQNACAG